MRPYQALAGLTLLSASAVPSQAQSLTVSPVTLDIPYGVSSAVLSLETNSTEAVTVQARVFRWSQAGGQDKFEKTEDVAVSPPFLKIRRGPSNTIRLIRTANTPVSGEETYRIFIDEIPDRKKLQAGTVALTIRQSLPVFFAGADTRPGSLTWAVLERKGKLVLEASNTGQKRVKLFNISAGDGANRDLVKDAGLAYVLGGQTKSWELPSAAAAKPLTIKAQSDAGPIHASAIAKKGG